MTMAETESKEPKKSIFKRIFSISLLYYWVWFLLSVYWYFAGIEDGWGGSSSLVYGPFAFVNGLFRGIICTIYFFWFIPLYQIIYIICTSVKRSRKKSNN